MPMIEPLMRQPDVVGSGFLHIVVMDPGLTPPDATFDDAVLLEHSLGDRARWDADYASFARAKALLSWKHRQGSHALQATAPHLLQEGHEPFVLAAVVVGQHLADVARVREALALGHAQEQARQPVGEVAADEQQVVVLELVEQLLGGQVLALQRADEFQQVLVGNDVGRRGGKAAEQVVNDRALQAVPLRR